MLHYGHNNILMSPMSADVAREAEKAGEMEDVILQNVSC